MTCPVISEAGHGWPLQKHITIRDSMRNQKYCYSVQFQTHLSVHLGLDLRFCGGFFPSNLRTSRQQLSQRRRQRRRHVAAQRCSLRISGDVNVGKWQGRCSCIDYLQRDNQQNCTVVCTLQQRRALYICHAHKACRTPAQPVHMTSDDSQSARFAVPIQAEPRPPHALTHI